MEEDDFGELYGDQGSGVSSIGAGSLQKSYPGFSFFDDEIEEDKGHVGASVVPTRPLPPPVTKHQAVTKLSDGLFTSNAPIKHDSDEDDDMLLLGYNSKSGSAANKLQANCTQAMVINDPEAEFAKLAEQSKVVEITNNGLVPLPANAIVPGITSTQELAAIGGRNPPNGSSDATSHTVTIPGLSTTVSAPFFDMGDSGDATQDSWEPRQVGNAHLRPGGDVALEGADDWDTDSDDDLRIVLNTEYPFYAAGEKGAAGRYEGGSEDEDDENLIIFDVCEPNEEGDDKLLQPLDAQVLQGDGLGDKQTGVEDGKGQQDKMLSGVTAPPQALRGYGYRNYNSPYKYVRAGATAVYNASGGQTLGGRGGPLKVMNGRADWRGPGRGLFGPHSTSQFSSWSTSSSYEYTLPPSMTVFDIDLEAFDDKPWRQPAVDVSDFFNFGFDETTWKDYCKQLAQLRLESTLQSKIRVYESGRAEQDYDPDLPPELALAAGIHDVRDKVQQRQGESDTTVSGMGRRGYTPMIPLGRPIEVEGGLGDRRPSADSRKQRIRDFDSILLIDAVEIEDLETEGLQDENLEGVEGEVDKDEMDDEQQQEDDQEEEDEEQIVEDPRAALKTRQEQHFWRKERIHGMRNNKGPSNKLNIESSRKLNEGNVRTGYDPLAVSTDQNLEPCFLLGNASEPSKLSGDSPAQREYFSRPKSTIKPHSEEKRDLDLVRSRSASPCQDAESNPKSGTGEGESDFKKPTDREQQLHNRKQSYARDEISAEEHQDGQSAGQRADELNMIASREAHKSPCEVQLESSGCSSKRQRLVSPEGSQTSSWDNHGVAKSGRSGACTKESRDSADSAMDAQDDSLYHRKKYRSYPEMSREDHYRDLRQESESHRKKKSSTSERPEFESEGHPHADSLQDTRKRPRQTVAEKFTSKESSRHWKDGDGARRDEEADKKGYPIKETLHHKDKLGNRSDSRKKDEDDREAAHYRDRGGSRPESRRKEDLEKRDKQDSRRRDAEDRRERFDKVNVHRENKDNQHRDRELELPNYLERRKREDDYRRKDRSAEGSDYSKKEREKNASERHDREADQHSRRKEEESWKRENLEDHHRAKARDGSLKDSEDSRQRNTEYQGEDLRQRNTEYQDLHGRVHRDEERAVNAAKSSRRHDEARSWRGRNDNRVSDNARSSEPRSHSKDRRKDLDDHGREKSRSHARSTSDRDGLLGSESHDRESLKRGKLSDDTKTYERGSHSEKHKSEAKRSRDPDKELNDLALQSGDHSNASRRKKSASEKTELATKKRLEDATTVRTRDSQGITSRSQAEESKEPTITKSERTKKVRHVDAEETEEDAQQKGRSKLERWMSHKDVETIESKRLIAQNKLKKDEKPKQRSTSRDKQSRDLSGLRDDIDQDKRQHVEVERKVGKISASEEQVNGKVGKLDEKGAPAAQSKEVDGNMVDKACVELPEHHKEDLALPHVNMAAKLEKRKERFKVHTEGKDSSRRQDYEDNQLMDKDDSRQERPPRKRRWASG